MTIRLPVIGLTDPGRMAVLRRAIGENFRRYLFRYMTAFAFMALAAGGTAGTAYLIKDFFNQVFQDRDAEMLWILVAAMFGLSIARGVGTFVSEVVLSAIGNRIVANGQIRAFEHILSLDP